MTLWMSALLLVVPIVGLADIAPKPLKGGDPMGLAIERFGTDLSKTLLESKQNAVFSPFSIEMAFAMVREGAEGETAGEIDRVMHLESFSVPGALSAEFARLDRALTSSAKKKGKGSPRLEPRITLANGVWIQEGFGIESPYRATLEGRYRAVARSIDLRDTEAAREEINEWVDDATEGRIEALLEEGLPTADTVLMLVNAIHFEGRWLHEFSEGRTAAAPFAVAADRRVEVEMMHLSEELAYAETENTQRVVLPYLGSNAEMVVILPKPGRSLTDLTHAERGPTDVRQMARGVKLALPKFAFGRTRDLIPSLKALGMIRAFEHGKAEFGRMSKHGPLAIGSVVHGAWIRVDEHGTEAAAATAISMLKGGFDGGSNAIEVTVDRPFLFHIRHTSTGVVLFHGRVEDPTRDS